MAAAKPVSRSSRPYSNSAPSSCPASAGPIRARLGRCRSIDGAASESVPAWPAGGVVEVAAQLDVERAHRVDGQRAVAAGGAHVVEARPAERPEARLGEGQRGGGARGETVGQGRPGRIPEPPGGGGPHYLPDGPPPVQVL